MMKLIIAALLVLTVLMIPKHQPPGDINKQVTTTEAPTVAQTDVTSVDKKKKVQTVKHGTVTPVQTNKPMACEDYHDLLARHFGAQQLDVAKAVMRAESGCRSDAIGDGHLTYQVNNQTYGMSCGLFQIRILPGRPSCEEMQNPIRNVEYAGRMFKTQGWTPWSAFNNGLYRQYL